MYAKLFSSLYQGTLRGKSHAILVFTNLLAHADKEGYVDKHFRAIAEETGLSQDEVRAAIAELEKPDPESRSPEMEGRRIVPIDQHRSWGWHIVNAAKYRAIRDEESRRETWRKSQQKRRASVNTCQHLSTPVNHGHPQSTHTEAEANTDAEVHPSISVNPPPQKPPRKPKADKGPIEAIYAEYPKKVGKADALKAIGKALSQDWPAERMLGAVKTYAECVSRWPKEDQEYVPHPATWFNRGSYEDDPATWERKGSKPKQSAEPPLLPKLPEPPAWRERWGMIEGNFPISESLKWQSLSTKDQHKYAAAIASIPQP